MKSKLVILSLLAAAVTTVTAQTKEKFYSEKAKDNVFISVGVGAQASMLEIIKHFPIKQMKTRRVKRVKSLIRMWRITAKL